MTPKSGERDHCYVSLLFMCRETGNVSEAHMDELQPVKLMEVGSNPTRNAFGTTVFHRYRFVRHFRAYQCLVTMVP